MVSVNVNERVFSPFYLYGAFNNGQWRWWGKSRATCLGVLGIKLSTFWSLFQCLNRWVFQRNCMFLIIITFTITIILKRKSVLLLSGLLKVTASSCIELICFTKVIKSTVLNTSGVWTCSTTLDCWFVLSWFHSFRLPTFAKIIICQLLKPESYPDVWLLDVSRTPRLSVCYTSYL